MRPIRLLGPALFVLGIIALAVALQQGQATLSLFLVFPVITASGPWALLGILLLVAGFFLSFLLSFPAMSAPPLQSTGAAPPTPASGPLPPTLRRWGGVVFLGPIPVVFGSDPRMAKWMLVAGALLFVSLVVLTILALRAI